ncbi:MAG: hypothetical protein NTW25_09185 [Candidatus Kapabacteria bacterium]|nr:hypothetical protein [Candidatus Kapabacteria bacterium]
MTKRKNTYNPETGEITLTQPVVSRPFISGPCVGISQTLVVGTKLKIDINQLLGTSSTMSLLAIDGIDKSGTLNHKFTVSDIIKMPKLSEWHIYGNEQQGRFVTRKPD